MSQSVHTRPLVHISGTTGSIGYKAESIDFEIVFTRRKTLQISVHADERVVVRAPLGSSVDKIAEWVLKKAEWVRKHQRNFRQRPPPRPLQFLSGELHPFLGNHYRLRVCEGALDRVTLNHHELLVECVATATPARTRQLLGSWYESQATIEFAQSVERCFPPFQQLGLTCPSLRIRRMKTRWGSLSAKNHMTLNLELINTPLECLDYVVTHELCHLLHRNHGPAFYGLLERVMSDWRRRRQRLKNTLS